MGINVTHVKDTLLADGVNKVFPFTFPVMDKADVKCLYVLPSGEETDLLATEYEVKLTDTGGEVTYPLTGDALAEGCKLVIYRETPRIPSTVLTRMRPKKPEILTTMLL